MELEDKAQSQWVGVNSRKKKFLTTSPFLNMFTKRKYKPNVEGKNYCLGRKNNKEIRELASKVDIVNGRQFTIGISCNTSYKGISYHRILED